MKLEKVCIILSSISMVCSLLAIMLIKYRPDNEQIVVEPMEIYSLSNYHFAYLEHTKLKVMMSFIDVSYETSAGHLEEEVSEEMNCLFYATVPIGRYYITAYNHEETGSKHTASGATCHEGTITTCAADVWGGYFKFGDVIEVDGRLFVVEDTGSAVKKKHIDLYFASYKAMAKYGSNYQTIYRVEFPFGKPKCD